MTTTDTTTATTAWPAVHELRLNGRRATAGDLMQLDVTDADQVITPVGRVRLACPPGFEHIVGGNHLGQLVRCVFPGAGAIEVMLATIAERLHPSLREWAGWLQQCDLEDRKAAEARAAEFADLPLLLIDAGSYPDIGIAERGEREEQSDD